jgi:transposase-like protein
MWRTPVCPNSILQDSDGADRNRRETVFCPSGEKSMATNAIEGGADADDSPSCRRDIPQSTLPRFPVAQMEANSAAVSQADSVPTFTRGISGTRPLEVAHVDERSKTSDGRRRWQRWTEDEARSALHDLAESGVSAAKFAESHGFCAQRFAYWRKRLRRAGPTTFVAVRLQPTASTLTGREYIEISADGMSIRVREDLDVKHVVRLVDALARRARDFSDVHGSGPPTFGAERLPPSAPGAHAAPPHIEISVDGVSIRVREDLDVAQVASLAEALARRARESVANGYGTPPVGNIAGMTTPDGD